MNAMTEKDCLFCRIARRQLETPLVYQDERVVVFRDINPQAPIHLLVIPRKHVATVLEIEDSDESLTGHMILVARNMAKQEKLESGFRIVMNTGSGAGQTVFHLHAHVLGGRSFRWPPG